MRKLWFILKKLWSGQSVTRAYLDYRLSQEVLDGSVIDIGGGKDSVYLAFMKQAPDTEFRTFDIKAGDTAIDFETDRLPAPDATYDTVLFLNVMEHIFNHQHIATEVVRITKPTGRVVGFVPFLMWYHADPKDFFRYTHEALEKILTKAGAQEVTVEPIGAGPYVAAAQMLMQSIPFRFLRPFIFLFFYLFDQLFFLLKGKRARVYALGYYFVAAKRA